MYWLYCHMGKRSHKTLFSIIYFPPLALSVVPWPNIRCIVKSHTYACMLGTVRLSENNAMIWHSFCSCFWHSHSLMGMSTWEQTTFGISPDDWTLAAVNKHPQVRRYKGLRCVKLLEHAWQHKQSHSLSLSHTHVNIVFPFRPYPMVCLVFVTT